MATAGNGYLSKARAHRNNDKIGVQQAYLLTAHAARALARISGVKCQTCDGTGKRPRKFLARSKPQRPKCKACSGTGYANV